MSELVSIFLASPHLIFILIYLESRLISENILNLRQLLHADLIFATGESSLSWESIDNWSCGIAEIINLLFVDLWQLRNLEVKFLDQTKSCYFSRVIYLLKTADTKQYIPNHITLCRISKKVWLGMLKAPSFTCNWLHSCLLSICWFSLPLNLSWMFTLKETETAVVGTTTQVPVIIIRNYRFCQKILIIMYPNTPNCLYFIV